VVVAVVVAWSGLAKLASRAGADARARAEAATADARVARLVKVALLGLSITLKRGKISVAEIHLGRDPIL